MGRLVLTKRPIFRNLLDFSDCTFQKARNATADEIYKNLVSIPKC